ncbi:MAG: cation:proton antiporter [Acidimicrobiales bacterium]|jgi:Kef-type K+ transport system membrane component KefB|nr:cation:proton antiporter [Acidimicrobiales bacterium]HMS87092.1 cation:proton antiporter [Acidimicrobiales bacterium]
MDWAAVQLSPAFGFTVVGLVIVFGPLVAERLRLPGLLGLLMFGAVIGPNMLDVLPRFTGLQAVGSIGVLYLIFLAGLQLDLETFVRYRVISGGFGLLTSVIPMALGTGVALLLDIDLRPALLIGSFWASFTLIAYPTVAKYGLTKTRPVAAIVGASAITDGVSLVVLALIVGAETGDASGARLVFDIALGFAVLGVYCFVVVPAIARWFFTGLGQERTLRYMLVFISLTSSAVVAELVGVEPLIGAFFVGVGLNRLVPNASPLMAVTDFFGNAFFIPTFLVSVGLLFDPEVMVEWSTIRLALGFVAALIAGKAIAAWITGRIFGLATAEVGLLFSMSVAQAAATLAATVIGFDIGLYGSDVVNAVMVVVAVSLIVTSIGTNRFAPAIPPPVEERRRPGETILVPVLADLDGLADVLRLGRDLAEPAGGFVQPLVPVTSSTGADLTEARTKQADVDRVLGELGGDAETMLRLDRSVSTGLHQAAIEVDASLLLLGWPGPNDIRARLVGATYTEIVAATSVPVAVAALHPGDRGRVVVYSAGRELVPGYLPTMALALDLASTLARHQEQALVIGPLAPSELEEAGLTTPPTAEHRDGDADLEAWVAAVTRPGDVVVVPIHDPSIGPAAIRVYASGRSVLAVSQNPETSPAAVVSPMNLPVGRSMGA